MKQAKNIIVAGVGPIPIGNPDKVYAPGIRLLAFSRYIHKAGYNVITAEAAFKNEKSSLSSIKVIEKGWERTGIPLDSQRAADKISALIYERKPIAVVSTTDVMNKASGSIRTDIPRWMDFFGHPMVERQEISYIHSCDLGLLDQWRFIVPALLTGDHFSVCSIPQKHALIGELGATGRLNQFTSGHDLVSVIPPGLPDHEPRNNGETAFRGEAVPKDAFCILWNGGFNTWVDENTLFKGIVYAMKRSEKIHFVMTGGAIKGHNEITFSRFRKKVKDCPYSGRFHFFGWVPLNKLPAFYTEADVAINIDRFTYEGILGCRNRVFSWIKFGIPVITTSLSENTKDLVSRNLAVGFPIGNASQLGEKLIGIMNNPSRYKDLAEKAKTYVSDRYGYETVLKPLIRWLESPGIAPDRQKEKLRDFVIEGGRILSVPDNALSLLHARKLSDEICELKLKSAPTSRISRWIKKLKTLL